MELMANNNNQNNPNDNQNNQNNNTPKEEKMGLFKRSKNFVKRNKSELLMVGLALLGVAGGAVVENKTHFVDKIKPGAKNDGIKRK
jgi:hypothetical protein